jgi:membrane-bound lytic murein transglycosylase MltF
LYEEKLNESLRRKPGEKVFVIVLPVPRDQLLSRLNDGKVDMVAAQLTVTPERSRLVDFTVPTRTGVNEIFVSGPGSQQLNSVDQLAGKTVFVRRNSSYHDSLQRLSGRLSAQKKQGVDIRTVPENLEDDDLLEMVNAGLLPATVVDDYLAALWKQVFPNLVLSQRAPLRTGGNLAVAIRKGSPQLAASLNAFVRQYGLNSAIGAVINKRYLKSSEYLKNAASDEERRKFLATVDLFRKYGGRYDFDYLLMTAQGYQESRLDQNAKSPVGAVGVMQLMPETGREQGVGDIHQVEPNVHAGVKYMSAIKQRYFANEPMDALNRELFAFASYNAGPGRIRQLRREAAVRGLNPNVWFGNVEQIAAEKIGAETVTYVGNIFKYYIAYKVITEEQKQRERAKQAITKTAAL